MLSIVLTLITYISESTPLKLNSETIDCDPNPCKNGGTCHDTGMNSFDCSCTEGFEGEVCQYGESA